MAAAKPRKRIVAELIVSPSQEREDQGFLLDGQPEASFPAPTDQKEQAEWARENLGPDRKVFLDLTAAENYEVDWRKICKERGVQNPSKAAARVAAEENGAGVDPLSMRGRSGRQEDSWTRMLAKLEATFCLGAMSEDEEDERAEEEGSESGGSDSEEEEGRGKGPGSDGGGGGEEGKEGKEGGGTGAGGKKKGGSKKGNDYDYYDEFIDDEEFLEFIHHDKRKPKHTGFFMIAGELERTDEMLPGFEDLEKEQKRGGGGGGGKRKAGDDKASAGEGSGAPPPAKEAKTGAAAAGGEKKKRKQAEAGSEAGGEGEEGKPAKKKKKVVPEAVGGPSAAGAAAAALPAGPGPKLSVAEMARMAGQMAAAGAAPPTAAVAPAGAAPAAPSQQTSGGPSGSQAAAPTPSAKKKVPYSMPRSVEEAITRIETIANSQPPPAPAPAGEAGAEEGGKKVRRVLPKPIRAALLEFQPLFLEQTEQFGLAAQTPILTALAFLEPFASRMSIANILRNTNKEKKPKEAKGLSSDQLKALISEKVKAVPVGSDDEFEAPPPPKATQGVQAGDATGAASQAHAGAAVAAAAGAPAGGPGPAAPAGPNKYLKLIDKGVQQQVYLFLKERLGEDKLHSPRGKLLLQEVYNWFPPNSIDMPGLTAIFNAAKNREKRAAERAAAAAAGGAQAGPAKQQQQQRGGGAGASKQQPIIDAALFAAMAVEAAGKKLGTPVSQAGEAAQQQQQPQQPQPQQQQQPLVGELDPAQVKAAVAFTASGQKVGVPANGTAAAEQQPQQQPAAAAAATGHGTAAQAGGSANVTAASHSQAVTQPLSAAAAVPQAVSAAAQEAADEAVAAAAASLTPQRQPPPAPQPAQQQEAQQGQQEAALHQQQQQQPAAPQPPQKGKKAAGAKSGVAGGSTGEEKEKRECKYKKAEPGTYPVSDDDLVAKMVALGCPEEQLRDMLGRADSNKAVYQLMYVKCLMEVGHEGITSPNVAKKAAEMQWVDWDPKDNTVKNSLARVANAKQEWIAYIGNSKYALRCLPGIKEVERPNRGKKGDKSVAAAPSSTGGGGSRPPSPEGPSHGDAAEGASKQG